jgi:catechol 2,3-dioxygenase-like lactoylglutathione lyase family enzyme
MGSIPSALTCGEATFLTASLPSPDPLLRIAGNHHVALVVEDEIDATHRFWTETMGLRFSWAITNLYVPSTGEYSPHMHTFYELATPGSNVAYFAIQPSTMNPGPNLKDHAARFLALQAGSEDQVLLWKERLMESGVAVSEESEEDGRPVLLFHDPAGHRFKIVAPRRNYGTEAAGRAQSVVARWIERHPGPRASAPA